MFVQLTNAGSAALDAAQGPVTVTKFTLGSGVAYTPEPTQTALQGTALFSGEPTSATPVTSQVWRYGCLLDSTVGPFGWGEIGLFLADGTLFAIAVSDTLIQKEVGESSRSDVFVSLVGTNYAMWLDMAESNNPFRVAVLGSVDQLPSSADASPNVYIVTGFQDDQQAFMAYTNRSGWWNFDAYDYASAAGTETLIQDVGPSSVSIQNSDYQSYMDPQTPGSVITEVVSGPAYSASRYVTGVVVGPSMTTLNFDTPWAVAPNVGDTIVFFNRRIDTLSLPIATHTSDGVVKVGQTLTVTSDGTIDVDYTQIPYPVTSFNGKTGAVTYLVEDQNTATGTTLITDSGLADGTGQFRRVVAGANVAISLDASNNLVITGTTSPYTLPIASATTLGGIMVGSGLAINGSGVLSATVTQTTVNGMSGNVTIEVVNNNPATGQTLIADTGATTGIAKLYTLVAGTNTTITQDTNQNLVINNTYTLPIAGVTSAGTLGGVRVDGTSVTIDGNGVISSHVDTSTLSKATTTTPGVVEIGPTLAVDGNGVINYNLPIAGTGSSGVLGGVKVDGTTITINNATGVISATGSITSVNGQSGAVVIKAVDQATSPTGVSWITDSGATTGTIKLRQVVPGNGTAVTTDSFGNLQIGLSQNGYLTGVTFPNLMWNENGEFGNTGTTYAWTDSLGLAISIIQNTSSGYFFRVATRSTAATGTIKSPMFACSASTQHVSRLWMRPGLAATGTYTYQVIYYNSSGTVVTTGNVSPALPLSATSLVWTNLFTPADTTGSTVTQFQVVINYQNATWDTLDWARGKVEASAVTTSYTQEGTIDHLVQLINNTAYTLPVATTTVLGGVKQGSNVTIAGDGTLSVTGVVTSVNSLSGAVTILASDNNTATGTSLIANSGATTGNIKLLRIVAGNNITIGTDGSSNLVISGTVTQYTLPVATSTVLGGVKQGTGVTIAGDGTISVNTSPVTSVSGQTGNVVISAQDTSGASGTTLITNSGSTSGTINLRRIVAGTSITLATDGNNNLVINGPTTVQYYDIQAGAAGTLTSSQIIGQTALVRSLTLPASLTGSVGYAGVAAAASATIQISIWNNGTVTGLGTVVFAAGSNTATFTGGGITLPAGQVVIFTAPATADTALANVSITLLGTTS